jgi:hypothetical protein
MAAEEARAAEDGDQRIEGNGGHAALSTVKLPNPEIPDRFGAV